MSALDDAAAVVLGGDGSKNLRRSATSAPERNPRAERSDQLRAMTVRGLALNNLPRVEWIVDGLVPARSLVLMYGPPKVGKSFVAIDLAACIATGRSWLGQTTKRGPVLYVAAEGAAGITARQEAWSEYHGPSSELDEIYWLPTAINLYPGSIRADTEAVSVDAGAVADMASAIGARLVVIDTLARCTTGAEENSAKDMGLVIASADYIKTQSGATVLVVHHSGKDVSKGARGSTALFGAVDSQISVSGSGRRVTVKLEDCKDGPSGFTSHLSMEPHGASVVLVPGPGGEPLDSAKTDTVLSVLADTAGADGMSTTNWREMCEEQGVSKPTFFRARKALEEGGKIRNLGTTNRTAWVVV